MMKTREKAAQCYYVTNTYHASSWFFYVVLLMIGVNSFWRILANATLTPKNKLCDVSFVIFLIIVIVCTKYIKKIVEKDMGWQRIKKLKARKGSSQLFSFCESFHSLVTTSVYFFKEKIFNTFYSPFIYFLLYITPRCEGKKTLSL